MSDVTYEKKYFKAQDELDELKALMREAVLDDNFCQKNPSFKKQWNDVLDEEETAETSDRPIWLTAPKKPIWLVWSALIGADRILYYLRSISTIKERAEMNKKTVETEPKYLRGRFQEERKVVYIEESLTNHFYGETDMRVAGEGPRGNIP